MSQTVFILFIFSLPVSAVTIKITALPKFILCKNNSIFQIPIQPQVKNIKGHKVCADVKSKLNFQTKSLHIFFSLICLFSFSLFTYWHGIMMCKTTFSY
jgi:hypothetical protein